MVSKWVKLGVWVLTHPWRCLHVSFANGIWENTAEDPYKVDTWVKAKKKELAEAGICVSALKGRDFTNILWHLTRSWPGIILMGAFNL
ncbi:hypothetical protein EYR41_007527 [Orbilia oligospora]|uniref:Uncharacterized protein n=1 Tax=Orbilia oligospora TaxID=2813651 RepID=A0A7C8PW46_ORBOL|nr:hypothetical protein TWF751_008409 [Orbilia oligospora]TGJ68479.1 hypothetical protein EYR41_007527 [Orbilia oligospora]